MSNFFNREERGSAEMKANVPVLAFTFFPFFGVLYSNRWMGLSKYTKYALQML